jgi:glycosyltransferase involved in cell wall biosynthesis
MVMRASIIIASHNEGSALSRTIESCTESSLDADCEIVVADDASTDGSVDAAEQRFPLARIIRHSTRLGASPAKDLGARNARGDVLVFLDAHTKPEFGAISQLIRDVEAADGLAIVTPAIAALQEKLWQNDLSRLGHGYAIDLRLFEPRWLALDELEPFALGKGSLLESPALMGAAFAVGRDLYQRLWGFDGHMRSWGVEDLDFGLKCWQFGYPILHDPDVVIGHRFQDTFRAYKVPVEHVLLNKLRMARKNFTESVWMDWLAGCRQSSDGTLPGHPEGLWAHTWQLFEEHRPSVEQERSHVQAHRNRDEFRYAEQFALTWPRLAMGAGGGASTVSPAAATRPSTMPAPSPVPSAAPPLGYDYLFFGGPGGAAC